MAEGDRVEPLERLLNLVALLLETPTPLTFEQIRRVLEPYGQANADSAKRMFERDKDVLREFGVPLELVDVDVWGTEQGYVIPKEKYYLPEIEFEPGELAALLVAAQSGGRDPAAEAGARKLLFGAEGGGVLGGLAGGPLTAGSDARGDLVQAAAEAAQGRRHVRFAYRTSQGQTGERDVDAWAMVFRTGHWYLVGHDHERDAVRAFRLSRVVGELTDAGEGSDPPDGFRAADHVASGPWVVTGEDTATVLFSPERAWLAVSQFPGVRQTGAEDGWVVTEIPMADEASLAAMLLEYGPDAVVRSPDSLREAVIARLESMRA